MIPIWTLDHHQFAEIVAGVERLSAQWPRQDQWREPVVALWSRPFGDL